MHCLATKRIVKDEMGNAVNGLRLTRIRRLKELKRYGWFCNQCHSHLAVISCRVPMKCLKHMKDYDCCKRRYWYCGCY